MTSQAQITLIEVKYTRDTDPSRTHQDPYQQHESLYHILRKTHPSAIIERWDHPGSCRSSVCRSYSEAVGVPWSEREPVTKLCT